MEKILQLESSNLFISIVRKIIEPRGFEVLSTKSSSEAFDILEKNKISLIITGNELKDTTGEEFVQKISTSKHSDIPVIVLTSTDSLELRTRLFTLGIVDYILKKDITTSKLGNYFDSLIKQDHLIKQIQEENIAVLDDSKFGLAVIKNILRLHRIHKVHYYTDPHEFLKDAHNFSFFLVDLVLPEISGEDVIVELKKRKKDCVIIVVSGISHFKTISQALMYGADDYISKPFDDGIFMARLKSNARTYFLYKELEKRAITDGLTGLYNHKYIYDYVSTCINKKGAPFCVLLIDIDHFKSVNDTYGHQVGDLVLMSLAGLFIDFFEENGICGRYGGEEFMVILNNTSLSEGAKAADLFREKVMNMVFPEQPFGITISGGIVEYKDETSTELIKKSDDFLYRAKNDGRNRILSSLD